MRCGRRGIAGAMSHTNNSLVPRWPAFIDPTIAYVDYNVPADEFLVYFGGKPVPNGIQFAPPSCVT